MYQAHWGLRDTPFRACHGAQFFYESPTHEEALARLHFLVEQQRRLGLLIGGRGSGKSMLLEIFAAQLQRGGARTAQVNLTGIDLAELLWQLNSQLGPAPGRTEAVGRLWRRLTDLLAEYRYQQITAALLLDDADRAAADLLPQIVRLAQHDRWADLQLTIILTARSTEVARLGETLLDLAELRIDLESWDAADTQKFLQTSLDRAGCSGKVFAPPAAAKIHELARGVPRHVSQLADLSLVAGAGAGLQEIDATVVESVYRELCLVRG